MITHVEEYKKLVNHRLDENMKSFNLLFGIQHYGNCISIMCQELDQIMKLLYLLNKDKNEQKNFIEASIDNHKWFTVDSDNKKRYVTDEDLINFSNSIVGWDKSIYEFGLAFSSLNNSFNYGSKDPIKSMNEFDREKLYSYIREYHKSNFPKDFTLDDLIPILPMIFELISINLQCYMKKL
jgi:hypothetical protein